MFSDFGFRASGSVLLVVEECEECNMQTIEEGWDPLLRYVLARGKEKLRVCGVAMLCSAGLHRVDQ